MTLFRTAPILSAALALAAVAVLASATQEAKSAAAQTGPIAATESSQTPAAQPIVIDLPLGILAGERLLFLLAANSSAGVGFGNPPSGWTRVVERVGTFNATAIYTKIADGSEGISVTMPATFGNPTQHWSARITGADPASQAISTSSATATTSTPDPPAHAPRCWGAADVLWISWLGKRLSGTATDYPDNYSLYQFTEGYVPPSGTGAAVAVAARQLTAASEDPNTFTIADGGNSSFGTLAIRLATPPPPSPCLPIAADESSQTPRGQPVVVDLPAGIQAGDRLLTLIAAHSSAGVGFGAGNNQPPSGWTQVVQRVGTFNATAIYTRIASGSEGASVTMPWTHHEATQHWSARITGADPAATAISTSSTTGTTFTPDPPAHAPSWGAADTLWIAWVGKRLAGAASDYPDNYSLYQFTEGFEPGGFAAFGAAVAVAARRLTAASDDPNTFTVGDGGNSSFGTLAIRLVAPPPASPGGQSTGTFCNRGSLAMTGTCTLSDPVNTLTGAFITQVEDLATPGTGVSFAWSRSYTSADTTVGPLGPGWTHTYAASLAVQGNGDVLARGEEGQQLYFTKQGDGSFVDAAGGRATLSSIAGGYKLVRQDQVTYLFDTQGRLTSVKDRNDQGLTLAYDGQGRLQSLTDASSSQTTVSYNASNFVSQVSTQDGRSVSYGYTSGRLTSVTDVRGKTWTYSYDAGGRLATIVDPLSHTQVTNVYGGDGRVQSQTDAVGKTTTFAWDQATQIATVTDANSKVWKHDYDADVLAKEIDPLNNVTQLGHDADLNTSSVIGPTSETTSMSYDVAGNLLQATAPASLGGVQKTIVYNARNDPTQITDARSKVTAYTYDASGNTATATQDGTQVGSYTYDSVGRVLTFTDGNSKTTTRTYFPATGYLQSVTDALGNTTTYTYDGAGRVLTRVDPKGNVTGCGCASQFTWSYTYNPAGQVLTETDPLGKVATHTYDDAGNELTVTDANGKTTTYAYDNANRLLSVTAPDTGVTSYTYDDVGNKLTETDPLNHTTTNTYDSANRLASSTTASGAKTTFLYDANGNLIKQVEPRGNVGGGVNPDDYATTFTYDAAGRLLTETDPLGNVTTHTYDAVGNELTLKDPNNKTTTSTYDGLNRLSTVTAPDGGVTTYTYDPAGNKLTEKDPRNNVTTFSYDDASRLSSVTKPAGGKTTSAYDANGNQTSMVEPRGNVTGCGCASQYTWTYAFDRVNRKLSATSPLGHTTSFAHDSVGNQLSVTDANGHATAYTYDSVNRLKTVTAADLGVTTYTYDLAGDLTQRTDARNNVMSYGYDVDNRRTSVTNPLSKVWTTSYDPAGNVQTTVDANGNATPAPGDGTTTFTYNRAGRLTGIDYSDATPDVTLTYDNAGNRLSMVDGSGTETRSYDSVNRLSSVARGTDTFSYAYDLAGNLTQRTYPGAVQTGYTYDTDNRLATAVDGTLTTTYAYDPAGNLTLTTLPSANGHSDTRVYDAAGRLIEVKNVRAPSTVRSRFVIILDAVSNPTRIDRTGSLVQTQTYSYDASDRILTVCFVASCAPTSPDRIAWTYDLVGNRLQETRSTGTTNYTYNAGDQMLTAGSTSYSYDQNGNQLSAGGQPFTYDLANRLKTTTQGATTTTHTYDGDGKRLQASTGTAASAKTNFLWDVNHSLPQVALERNGSNVLQRQYIYGLRRIRQTQGTGTYYLYDGLGSVVNTTAPLGALQKTLSYEPFGQIRTTSGSSPTNFWHFTGEYLDPTGLYHLRARQYDPANGRFLRLDPLAQDPLTPSSSPYSYVENRATALVDPSGLVLRPANPQLYANIPSSPFHDSMLYEYSNCLANALSLSCPPEAFIAASWDQRIKWVRDLQELHQLGGWFNVFDGILEFFGRSSTFATSKWAKRADGYVLWKVQVGLQRANSQVFQGSKWAQFFGAYFAERSAPTLRRFWGRAEQEAVNEGVLLANYIEGDPGTLAWLFIGAGNQYRSAVTSNQPLKLKPGQKALGFKETVGPADPRQDAGVVLWNARRLESLFLAGLAVGDFLVWLIPGI